MKMVKSLLLGSAAGVVAVAGAQAADLPVKAKAVEYVKICSLYGAGFYYMPGTNVCLKIGGYVRAQYYWNYGSTGTASNFAGGGSNNTRANAAFAGNHDYIVRARTILTADARHQSEYGTVRAYMNVGATGDSPGATGLYSNRAFIQFAGFTMGLASSYYDFYSAPAAAYLAAHPGSDTGDGGWKVFAYTAQLGNGVSATLSIEEPRRTSVYNDSLGANTFIVGAQPTNVYGNINAPDIVGNLRIEQAWGSAQIMAAAHQVRASYFGTAAGNSTIMNGHPDDEWGYAVGAGLRLKTDFITPGSYFQGQITYAKGAIRYLAHTPFGTTNSFAHFDGAAGAPFVGELGLGWVTDGIFQGANSATAIVPSIQLTTGWALNLSYEHVWNRQWKTSVYGGYLAVNYNNTANNIICTPNGGTAAGSITAYGPGCNADWSSWWIGSRTQWNITPLFYVGVDVLYTRLNSMDGTFAVMGNAIGGRPAGTYLLADQDGVAVTFRAHYDFYP